MILKSRYGEKAVISRTTTVTKTREREEDRRQEEDDDDLRPHDFDVSLCLRKKNLTKEKMCTVRLLI